MKKMKTFLVIALSICVLAATGPTLALAQTQNDDASTTRYRVRGDWNASTTLDSSNWWWNNRGNNGNNHPGQGGGQNNGTFKISNVDFNQGSTSARISWTTDKDTIGAVWFGPEIAQMDTRVPESGGLSTDHWVTLTGLTPDTTYFFRIRAHDGDSNREKSVLGSFTTTSDEGGTGTTTDTTAPSVPTNLTATASLTLGEIDLSWSASTDDVGVAGYNVYRDGSSIATTTGISYSDMNLASSTTYSYTVSAFDAAGNVSSQSGAVVATTTEATSTPDVTAPIISSLTTTGSTIADTVLIWTTDEPSNSQAWFSTTTPVSTSTAETVSSATLTTSHQLSIPLDLATSTGYFYTISSTDASNNTSFMTGNIFTTPSI